MERLSGNAVVTAGMFFIQALRLYDMEAHGHAAVPIMIMLF